MANLGPISVADLRADLGDVLSRAHYQGEVITIAKRDKPFAIVASVDAGQRLSAVDHWAEAINIDRNEFVEHLTSALNDPGKLSAFKAIVGKEDSQ